ncbi:hypothetical protein CFC21_035001 [Triticum aestivum]|uniref:FHA domain-containing protein n=3 Tax=Triticum TaxID=4564 RepID=A0A9R0VJR3_TRITD|nr:ABC transporter F family member 4-like isoform X2 [Triticum aestivum]KAF7022180.1 hypothetical protein CFC21_035001 [Triticum aestivum]VAH59802.1 unnamed protein product [Triticum turgidum subsp. durum]
MAAPPPVLTLAVEKGPRKGEICQCSAGSVLRVGRVIKGNHFAVRDKGASQQHLSIEFLPPPAAGWVASDLGSSNGSFLNDVPLEPFVPTPLSHGNLIKIGESTVLAVSIPSNSDLSTATAADPGTRCSSRYAAETAAVEEEKPPAATRRGTRKKAAVAAIPEVENEVPDAAVVVVEEEKPRRGGRRKVAAVAPPEQTEEGEKEAPVGRRRGGRKKAAEPSEPEKGEEKEEAPLAPPVGGRKKTTAAAEPEKGDEEEEEGKKEAPKGRRRGGRKKAAEPSEPEKEEAPLAPRAGGRKKTTAAAESEKGDEEEEALLVTRKEDTEPPELEKEDDVEAQMITRRGRKKNAPTVAPPPQPLKTGSRGGQGRFTRAASTRKAVLEDEEVEEEEEHEVAAPRDQPGNLSTSTAVKDGEEEEKGEEEKGDKVAADDGEIEVAAKALEEEVPKGPASAQCAASDNEGDGERGGGEEEDDGNGDLLGSRGEASAQCAASDNEGDWEMGGGEEEDDGNGGLLGSRGDVGDGAKVEECAVRSSLETMTLQEWFDRMEKYLPRMINEAADQMIAELEEKQKRVHEYISTLKNELNDTKICWRGRARLLALSAGVGPRRDMERTPYSSS